MRDAITIDLRRLRRLHPELPISEARVRHNRAAAAFERAGHGPGCGIELSVFGVPLDGTVRWRAAEAGTVAQTDGRGVTEFGAEGVALALAALAQDWVVLRRLQQGEFGDWLLHDADGETVALEVSGVAMSDDEGRMSEKLRQVAGAETVVKAACIVAFGPPKAALDVVGRR